MKVSLVTATSLAALALPASAAAHSRGPAVALDYRLRVDAVARGVSARVLDGDRSLRLAVAPGVLAVVLGYLGEPVLRFDDGGVWANRASPTASADRIVRLGRGWQRVTGGRTFAWHDHRLAPPAAHGRTGPVGRWTVPVVVDGQRSSVAGTFWRVGRPSVVPWLAGAVALAAAIAGAALRRRARALLTIALGTLAGVAALVAITTFAVRDAPTGEVAWLQLGAAAAVALVLGAILVAAHGSRRAHAAGVVGAVAAAASLGSLSVFWHGVVVSALSPTLARLACGLALVAGSAAGVLSVLVDEQPSRAAR
jgi:hypothetical protein